MVSNSKAESLALYLGASFRQDPEPMITWTQPREGQWTNTCMEERVSMYPFPAIGGVIGSSPARTQPNRDSTQPGYHANSYTGTTKLGPATVTWTGQNQFKLHGKLYGLMSVNIHKCLHFNAVNIYQACCEDWWYMIWYHDDILSTRCKGNYATECSLSSVCELGDQDDANKFPADCTSVSPTSLHDTLKTTKL